MLDKHRRKSQAGNLDNDAAHLSTEDAPAAKQLFANRQHGSPRVNSAELLFGDAGKGVLGMALAGTGYSALQQLASKTGLVSGSVGVSG